MGACQLAIRHEVGQHALGMLRYFSNLLAIPVGFSLILLESHQTKNFTPNLAG